MILLMDGVIYGEWTPTTGLDERHLAEMVKEHHREVFGCDVLYLDLRQRLTGPLGATIPDGFAITFNPDQWWIVEVELSTHDIWRHIVDQLGRFITGINNHATQRQLADAFDRYIAEDPSLSQLLASKVPGERYRFLTNLVSNPAQILIVIDEKVAQLDGAIQALGIRPTIREFRTFRRSGEAPKMHEHIHQFEPLVGPAIREVQRIREKGPEAALIAERQILLTLSQALYWKRYHLIPVKRFRSFFPGYKVEFEMETDKGTFRTWVSSQVGGRRGGAEKVGDPTAGFYIQRGLKPWFDAHPELRPGSQLGIESVEPFRRYRLSIVRV